MIVLGSRFGVRAQQLCGSGPRSPKQWICREWVTRTGLWYVNDDHQGISHRPNLTERISPRQNPRSFSWCFQCVGIHPPPFVSLYSHFIVVFLLLTEVPRVGTCPIRSYFQLLGVVVRTEKYGCVRHKALNTIKAACPCTLSFYLLSFSTFVLFLPCGTVWSFAIDGLLPFLPSAISIRGGFFHGRRGVFPWTGPLA